MPLWWPCHPIDVIDSKFHIKQKKVNNFHLIFWKHFSKMYYLLYSKPMQNGCQKFLRHSLQFLNGCQDKGEGHNIQWIVIVILFKCDVYPVIILSVCTDFVWARSWYMYIVHAFFFWENICDLKVFNLWTSMLSVIIANDAGKAKSESFLVNFNQNWHIKSPIL